MVDETPLEETEFGLAPAGQGWFILNAREAPWIDRKGFGFRTKLDGFGEPAAFPQFGIGLQVVEPGEPMSMYHRERDQEDFLILSGEALAIVEGEERPMRQWDLLHCPADTDHAIVGAGDGPCLILAVGSRTASTGSDWGVYPVNDAAIRRGAGVSEETADASAAYPTHGERETTRYRDGWLPG